MQNEEELLLKLLKAKNAALPAGGPLKLTTSFVVLCRGEEKPTPLKRQPR